jgi:WD40 repeat protein
MKILVTYILIINVIFSQKLIIHSVDNSEQPLVTAEIYTFTGDNIPNNSLDISDFSVRSSEEELNIAGYNCPTQNLYSKNNLLIYFDLNMLDSENATSLFSLVNNLLENNSNPELNSAIVGFDRLNYLYKDFDKTIDINSLVSIQQEDYANIWESFNFQYNNPRTILEKMEGNKQILVFTSTEIRSDIDQLVSQMNSSSITINIVALNPNESLEELTNRTGGNFIKTDNLLNELELINTFIAGYQPCTLTWEISSSCEDAESGTITADFFGASDTFNYTVLDNLKPRLDIDPPNIEFRNIVPGEQVEQEVFITAVNGDIEISELTLRDRFGGVFDISNEIVQSDNFILSQDQQYAFKFTYSPVDSSIVYSQVNIDTDACFGKQINILCGFPNVAPSIPTIQLTSPKCDQTIVSGDEIDVTWTGLLPRDVIQLEYSTNNGGNWDTLAKNVSGLIYKWKVPDISSEECLVRAIQLWPNNIGETLNLKHPKIVNGSDSLTNRLSTAFFNNTGDLIITAAFDGKVRIWNALEGILELELEGHNSTVVWADFAPDGNLAVSGDQEGNLIVWFTDPTGSLYGTISNRNDNAHSDDLRSIEYSPDGEKILTTSRDKTYKIWNRNASTEIFSGTTPDNDALFGAFEADGTGYFISGSEVVYRYDNNNNQIGTYDFSADGFADARDVTHISVSPDNKLLAATSRLTRLITIFDIESADIVYRLWHFPSLDYNPSDLNEVYTTSFHYDDTDSLLFSSGEKVGIRWDIRDGDSTATFDEHTALLQTGVYNFDGSLVVTSSWDGNAKIWRVKDGRDLQMDSTDCVFKILSAALEASNITFSENILGEKSTLDLNSWINNTSDADFMIDTIKIIGSNRNSFNIENFNLKDTLYNASSKDIKVSFTPQSIGLNEAMIQIIFPSDTIEYAINGIGLEPDFSLINPVIDLGKVELGDLSESDLIDILSNVTPTQINIDSTVITGPNNSNFVPNLITPSSVLLGENIQANIQFIPDTFSVYNAGLKIFHSGRYKSSKILLLGEGVPVIIDSVFFSIPDFEGNAGDIVSTNIVLDSIHGNGIDEDITGFNFVINFNSTLLEPLFQTISDEIDGNNRKVELELPVSTNSSAGDVLSVLDFRAALGNDSTTQINIETITPIGLGKTNINWSDANFRLLDLCYEGGTRLIQTIGEFNLDQNFPNPVSSGLTEIHFETIEEGNTRLTIVDANGDNVLTLIDDELPVGKHKKELNSETLPSGIYFYILESPTYTKSKKLIIK